MHLTLIILGLASVLGLSVFGWLVVYDREHARSGKPPRTITLGIWSVTVLGWFFCLFQLVVPFLAPAFFGLFSIAALLFKRVPAGSNTFGLPTHHRWVVRFGLAQLVAMVLILGAVMGWFFYLVSNFNRLFPMMVT